MAIKAQQFVPAYALEHLDFAALRIKARMLERISVFTGGTDANEILAALNELAAGKAAILEHRDVPGLREYAQAQRDDGTYEIVTEYQAFIALIDDAAQAIRAGFPKDGDNFLLIYTLVNDKLQPRPFSSAAVAPLVTKLQAIVDHVQ